MCHELAGGVACACRRLVHVCLCTTARLQDGAAVIAALGYMFAGKWLLHVLAGGHYIMIPLAWLPLVLLLLERAIERGAMMKAAWAGVVFAMIVLGTHPQLTLYAGLFIALWTFGDVIHPHTAPATDSLARLQDRIDYALLRRWLGMGAVAAIVAVVLSAIQLLPALEAASEASRATGVSVRDILAAALPSLLGVIGPGWTPTWEDRAGLGVLWTAAAVTAPFLCRGRTRYEAFVCLLLLLFSVGGAAVVHWLPGFRLFQIPGRMLMLLALPVALLAGRATQALLGPSSSAAEARELCRSVLKRVAAFAVLLAAGTALLSYAAWQQGRAGQGSVASTGSVLAWLGELSPSAFAYWGLVVLIFLPIAFWLLRRGGRLQEKKWAWSWGVVLLAELWAFNWPLVAVRCETEIYAPSESLRFLAQQRAQKAR